VVRREVRAAPPEYRTDTVASHRHFTQNDDDATARKTWRLGIDKVKIARFRPGGRIMVRPETHYARSGEVHVAYQVHGSGTTDLVYIPGIISNLDVQWEEPGFVHLLGRLGAFSRLVLFDKRGTGLSDPVAEAP
jgi:hypothetical protein